ncbi:juvenile hormone esterase-like [Periplaneta americana]|uniref:juvenile hormone esterase-like n=1 Tax=Periplaneta americana TaxID=6978 RepID=UPI0037E808E3
MVRLQVLVVLAVAAAALAEHTVTLKQGRLRGHVLKSRKGRPIYAFQGIPYAKPPVGDLRFKAPQPPEPWEGVLDATKEGAVCVQVGFLPGDLAIRGNEDCLYLNVYTPQRPTREVSKLLDVMFWSYGGSWVSGSGNTDFYGPQYLLDKDVMLVTINYRLGIQGFLSTEDEACPGNNGLKDHVAALRWVRDNIAAFGGNPDSVTIFGQSSGGVGVHYLMLSPSSRGLFHRAISQSGVAISTWVLAPRGQSRRLAGQVAALFNCPTESSSELVACLREQDAYKLYSSSEGLTENNQSSVSFLSVVEPESKEAIITEEPFKILVSGTAELVPWMTGVTSNEGCLLTSFFSGVEWSQIRNDLVWMINEIADDPRDSAQRNIITKTFEEFYYKNVSTSSESALATVKFLSDILFNIRTDTAVKLHSRRRAKVYYYEFDYLGSHSFNSLFFGPANCPGATHLDDIIYLFPQNSSFPNSTLTASDERMVDLMVTWWTNFARTGNPTRTWKPVSSPDIVEYARLDAEGVHMGHGLFKEQVEVWNSLPVKYKYPWRRRNSGTHSGTKKSF